VIVGLYDITGHFTDDMILRANHLTATKPQSSSLDW